MKNSSSVLQQRIDKLLDLRKQLACGNPQRQIGVGSYVQLLDYHVRLLYEMKTVVDAIREGNKEMLEGWIKSRVWNDEVHTAEPENTQQLAAGVIEAGTNNEAARQT